MSEQYDLEAQERAALNIGDRQAAAKARARIEDLAAQSRPQVSDNPRSGQPVSGNDAR